ncbi:MAG: hypothetical protein MRT15_06525 [archaeon YNP-LCB-003-016]|nr:hypothetical protein [Candidatus Culexarchaeum yellowstonense]
MDVCDSASLKVREATIEEKKLKKLYIFLVDDVKFCGENSQCQ